MLIFGTKYKESGGTPEAGVSRCNACGFEGHFLQKSGRPYFTIYFVIPIFPVGGASHFLECPRCKTRYDATANP